MRFGVKVVANAVVPALAGEQASQIRVGVQRPYPQGLPGAGTGNELQEQRANIF